MKQNDTPAPLDSETIALLGANLDDLLRQIQEEKNAIRSIRKKISGYELAVLEVRSSLKSLAKDQKNPLKKGKRKGKKKAKKRQKRTESGLIQKLEALNTGLKDLSGSREDLNTTLYHWTRTKKAFLSGLTSHINGIEEITPTPAEVDTLESPQENETAD